MEQWNKRVWCSGPLEHHHCLTQLPGMVDPLSGWGIGFTTVARQAGRHSKQAEAVFERRAEAGQGGTGWDVEGRRWIEMEGEDGGWDECIFQQRIVRPPAKAAVGQGSSVGCQSDWPTACRCEELIRARMGGCVVVMAVWLGGMWCLMGAACRVGMPVKNGGKELPLHTLTPEPHPHQASLAHPPTTLWQRYLCSAPGPNGYLRAMASQVTKSSCGLNHGRCAIMQPAGQPNLVRHGLRTIQEMQTANGIEEPVEESLALGKL